MYFIFRNVRLHTKLYNFTPISLTIHYQPYTTTSTDATTNAQQILKKVRLKKKLSTSNDNNNTQQTTTKKRASFFDIMKAHDKRVEKNYKYISPRFGRIILGLYFLFAFGCLGYIYFNNLLPSRLMFIQPFMQNINPIRAQQLGLKAVQWPRIIRRTLGLVNNPMQYPIKLFNNCLFPNPIGLSAGYDKNGKGINGFLEMGFGFIEIGTVTPIFEDENTKKGNTIVKLNNDHGLIYNCIGSDGIDAIRSRLEIRMENMDRSVGMLGVNIGYNKNSININDKLIDYGKCLEKFIDLVDYFTINIDNTNFVNMSENDLTEIFTKLISMRDEFYKKDYDKSLMAECVDCQIPAPGLFIKINLDITESQLYNVMNAIKKSNINGIIIGGSTKQRSNKLKSKQKYIETPGYLSGVPTFKRSNDLIKKVYSIRYGYDKEIENIEEMNKQECFSKDFVIIGSGGVWSAKDAYKKMRCGATLVQIYSGLQYHGPIIMAKILRQLGQYAELDGFETVFHAIGADVREEKGLDKIGILPPDLEELMAELIPVPQKSFIAKTFGVITYD